MIRFPTDVSFRSLSIPLLWSCSGGILDDETYDWAWCVKAMRSSKGGAFAVPDTTIQSAFDKLDGVACHTGAVALAGCLQTQQKDNAQTRLVIVIGGVMLAW